MSTRVASAPRLLPRASGPQTLPSARPPHCRLCLDRPPLAACFAIREGALNTAWPSAGRGLRCALGPPPAASRRGPLPGGCRRARAPGPWAAAVSRPLSAWCAQGVCTEGAPCMFTQRRAGLEPGLVVVRRRHHHPTAHCGCTRRDSVSPRDALCSPRPVPVLEGTLVWRGQICKRKRKRLQTFERTTKCAGRNL